MKIITWNCNMAFRKKWHLLTTLCPDIIVVQECEHPSKFKNIHEIKGLRQFLWYGDNPHKGVGILNFSSYTLQLDSNYNSDFKYIIPIIMDTQPETMVYVIWAMPNPKSRKESYVGQIWNALSFYKKYKNYDSIFIGDFNSHIQWDNERKKANHSSVTEVLKEQNIISLYHHYLKLEQGEEKHPTLYLLKKKHKPFHMDYCYLSKAFIDNKTTIEVGNHNEWIKYSDHMPLIIENVNIK